MNDVAPPWALGRIELRDLPRYTPWIARLVDSSDGHHYKKTRDSVLREFESEKWSALYSRMAADGIGLDAVERLQFVETREIAISWGSGLYLADPLDVRKGLASAVADRVNKVHSSGSLVVELGAGTGAVIIRMAKEPRFAESRFLATDLCASSIRIIDHLAKSAGVVVETRIVDLADSAWNLPTIEGATVFLSFAGAYLPDLDADFWERLASLGPSKLVVAEPIYQFFHVDDMLGLLRKRYCEVNGYSQSILPSIEAARRGGILEITEIEENAIGVNPLCPVSFLALEFQRPS
jgi:hypothetical protein